jgi:anti-sigma B factor antagonist
MADVNPLTVSDERVGDDARVVLAGELDIGSSPEVEKVLQRVEAGGPANLTIDLRGLTFMDSTGLRMLVAADKRARDQARTLRIIRGPAPVQRILDLTGLGDKLPLVDDA